MSEKMSKFDGETYVPAFDEKRLKSQLKRVFIVMQRREWLTLNEIAREIGDPPASISARLRDMRKPRFGEHTIERRRRGEPEDGLFEYRMATEGQQMEFGVMQ